MKPFYTSLPALKTKHLLLRPITMEDVPSIYQYAKDSEVSKLLKWYPPKSIKETKAIVQKWIHSYNQHKTATWGIVDDKTNKVIGTIDVRQYNPSTHQIVLGYCLSKAYWGKGLMAEAIRHVVNYLFSETDITEIHAFTRNDNRQSQRVLEKTGFILDKIKAKQEVIKGKAIALDRWTLNNANSADC